MKVILSKEANQQLLNLRKSDQVKINKKLILLKENPFTGKKLTGELLGLRSLKAWPYRIIYEVLESKKELWIVAIIHRQSAYG